MTLMSTQFVSVIERVGFPIAAFGLMYRFAAATLKENTRAIKNLTVAIAGTSKI